MDNTEIKNIDKEDLRSVILEGPSQFKKGFELAGNTKVEGQFNSIMISGMGGSALPGNILRIYINDLAGRGLTNGNRLAVYQNRFYSLPPEAYEKSLNFICSFSGNTEETITSFEEALENKLPCIGISSGGKIEEMCVSNGIPHIKLPSGIQPRMATGYFFAAIFKVLVNQGLVEDETQEILSLAEKLEEEMEEMEKNGKELAARLKGKTPIIYSSVKYKAVAMIWKIKINENSKTPAFWNFLPELNHNEMVGFTNPQGAFDVIILRDPNDHERNLKRIDITAKVLAEKGIDAEVVDMKGEYVFSKIFSCLLLGDWVSYYLALSYGQDPTPVEMVEQFKDLMK